jgi:hypothetical protein
MKRGNVYKQKHQSDVVYEKDSTGHKTPTPVVPDTLEIIYAADEAEENGAAVTSDRTYEQVRERVKSWLSNEGLSKPQQELVLGMVENRTTQALVAVTRRGKSWIYAERKKLKIKRAIEALKNGKAGQTLSLPSESQSPPSHVNEALGAVSFKFPDWNSVARLRGWTLGWPLLVNTSGSKAIPLCEVKRLANELFKEVGGMDKTVPSDDWPTSAMHPLQRQKMPEKSFGISGRPPVRL